MRGGAGRWRTPATEVLEEATALGTAEIGADSDEAERLLRRKPDIHS